MLKKFAGFLGFPVADGLETKDWYLSWFSWSVGNYVLPAAVIITVSAITQNYYPTNFASTLSFWFTSLITSVYPVVAKFTSKHTRIENRQKMGAIFWTNIALASILALLFAALTFMSEAGQAEVVPSGSIARNLPFQESYLLISFVGFPLVLLLCSLLQFPNFDEDALPQQEKAYVDVKNEASSAADKWKTDLDSDLS